METLPSRTEVQVDSTANPSVPSERVDLFVRLLAENQRRLYLYVHALVPNRSDADDIIQEASLVLWRSFDEFELGTNFAAWACRVTFNQILAWRKRRQRDRLEFSEELLAGVAAELSRELDAIEERSAALARCIEKLPATHRELIRQRYGDGHRVEQIAANGNKSVDAVYRMLSRIRQNLFDCVSRSLGAGES